MSRANAAIVLIRATKLSGAILDQVKGVKLCVDILVLVLLPFGLVVVLFGLLSERHQVGFLAVVHYDSMVWVWCPLKSGIGVRLKWLCFSSQTFNLWRCWLSGIVLIYVGGSVVVYNVMNLGREMWRAGW